MAVNSPSPLRALHLAECLPNRRPGRRILDTRDRVVRGHGSGPKEGPPNGWKEASTQGSQAARQ